jgi:hypothetical protein
MRQGMSRYEEDVVEGQREVFSNAGTRAGLRVL